jgi:hypothetical protein
MSLPAFSAQASLYSSSRRYRSSITESDAKSSSGHSIVPAYMPGPATQHDCGVCTGLCDKEIEGCAILVAAAVSAVCIGTLGFGCPGAVAAGEAVLVACAEAYAACIGYCNIPGWVPVVGGYCCPKICGFPNPLEGSGSGCCDLGENCVNQDDPNSRQGCCPSDQLVCGGNCCAKGERCCGDTCCPPDYYCVGGNYCSQYPTGNVPFGNPPPPPPPADNCIFGGEPCGPKCCPPGTHCCNYSVEFGPECRTSCWA